uniref:Uncharacterized protein n=1 Tax=Populus trichocarpa TaxID=3694 RepID=A0A2K2BA93_POPTR
MEGNLETRVFPYSMGHNLSYCSRDSPHTHYGTSRVFSYSSVASRISITCPMDLDCCVINACFFHVLFFPPQLVCISFQLSTSTMLQNVILD